VGRVRALWRHPLKSTGGEQVSALQVDADGAIGDRAWAARRFRPNVVVAGIADLDELVGERLGIGSVLVEVDKRTKRCAMPTMAQRPASGSAPR
jgi:uncharacterized protein YcbX